MADLRGTSHAIDPRRIEKCCQESGWARNYSWPKLLEVLRLYYSIDYLIKHERHVLQEVFSHGNQLSSFNFATHFNGEEQIPTGYGHHMSPSSDEDVSYGQPYQGGHELQFTGIPSNNLNGQMRPDSLSPFLPEQARMPYSRRHGKV